MLSSSAMSIPYACPHCRADLTGPEIPREQRAQGYHGPYAEGDPPAYYSRAVGITEPPLYDGVLYWQCPRCEGRWHRWPEGDRRRAAADPYVKGLM